MRKLKRDDEVIVITGKDKGKRGSISRLVGSDRVIVAGVNMVKRTPSLTLMRVRLEALSKKKRRCIFRT